MRLELDGYQILVLRDVSRNFIFFIEEFAPLVVV